MYWSAQVKAVVKVKRVWHVARGDNAPSFSACHQDVANAGDDGTGVILDSNYAKLDICFFLLHGFVKYHLRARWLINMISRRCESSYTNVTALTQWLSKPPCIPLLAHMRYIGNVMHEYVVKGALMSVHSTSMDGPIKKRLLFIRFLESFGDKAKSLFGSAYLCAANKGRFQLAGFIHTLAGGDRFTAVLKFRLRASQRETFHRAKDKKNKIWKINKNNNGNGVGRWYCGKIVHIKVAGYKIKCENVKKKVKKMRRRKGLINWWLLRYNKTGHQGIWR